MTHSRVDTIYNWWNRILWNLRNLGMAAEGGPCLAEWSVRHVMTRTTERR